MKFSVTCLDNSSQAKVATYNKRIDGGISLPMKYNGQIEGYLFRTGANSLHQDPSINWVEVQYGSSPTCRICRI